MTKTPHKQPMIQEMNCFNLLLVFDIWISPMPRAMSFSWKLFLWLSFFLSFYSLSLPVSLSLSLPLSSSLSFYHPLCHSQFVSLHRIGTRRFNLFLIHLFLVVLRCFFAIGMRSKYRKLSSSFCNKSNTNRKCFIRIEMLIPRFIRDYRFRLEAMKEINERASLALLFGFLLLRTFITNTISIRLPAK